MFDGRFRSGVDRVTRPVAARLRRTGLSADHLTGLGLLLAVPAAWAIASGRIGLGLALLIASAVPDLLDGPLAKATGASSVRGAFFDSVADRVTDTLVLGGFAWYLSDTRKGHLFILPVAILGVSLLISYQRAKAESLGLSAKGGIMERAERIVVLCAALAFGFLMVPLLWLMLALSALTALQRFASVWKQANAQGKNPPRREPLRTRSARRAGYEAAPVADRLRAWKEANGWGAAPGRYAARRSRPSGDSSRWSERRRARRDRRPGAGRP